MSGGRKINILLVSSKFMPEYSGSGYRAGRLYKRLQSKYPDINLKVLTGGETCNENARYEYDGTEVFRISSKPYPEISSNPVLRRFQISKNFHSECRQTREFLSSFSEKPDLIHIFGENYITASVIDYARRRKIPLLIELCNEMDTPFQFVPFPNKLFVSPMLPEKYVFVCISERLHDMCLKCGVPEKNLWCRPNPVDEERFHPVDPETKTGIRKELTKFDGKDVLLLYIAKYKPRKNHSFLIDVMGYLPEKYKLYMGGPLAESGPFANEGTELYRNVEERVEELDLRDRIQLSNGFYDDIERYYNMADIYLFPTLQEGLGTPMLESIACGLPIVANHISGITDCWIRNGENGFVLKKLEPQGFAEKIEAAAGFSGEKCLHNSSEITARAGTEKIDSEYFDIIKKLIEN